MPRKTEIIDDDGNLIPPPEPGSPVAQIIYLLEYGRKRGFQIGPRVQVGDTIVEVMDIRQAKEHAGSANRAPELDPDSDMALIIAGER
jgi:hypothetical protein